MKHLTHRNSTARNTGHPIQFGHNDVPSMFDATAATVRFNVEAFTLGPATAAHDHLTCFANYLHHRNQLVQQPMFA